ncbi:MAG: hypothetical protein ACOY4M_11005 [Pseudomonadota bacterium]
MENLLPVSYYAPVTAKFKKIPAILLLAFLQCVAPLLHAHPDSVDSGAQGVHAHVFHEPIELYCLSSERESCPELRISALDTPSLVASDEFFPSLNGAAPLPGFALPQRERRLTSAAALPGLYVTSASFITPLSHAPPFLF